MLGQNIAAANKPRPTGPRNFATLPALWPRVETRQGPPPNTPAPQAMRTAGGVTGAHVSSALYGCPLSDCDLAWWIVDASLGRQSTVLTARCCALAVPDLLGHRQSAPGGRIDWPIRHNPQLVLKDPHQLARMLSRMPCGPLEKFVSADVAIIDVCFTIPVCPNFRRFPPRLKAPADICSIGQNLPTGCPWGRDPIVRRRLQCKALLMLEQGIDHIKKVPNELSVGARSTRQLVAEAVLRNLGEETRCAIEDNVDASHQLGGRQVTDDAQIDANQARNFLKRLTVHPILAARNDGQLACSKRQQLCACVRVGQDVARDERYLVFAKELLSAQAAGSARLPIHSNGFCGHRIAWRDRLLHSEGSSIAA
jgi:hypothetical protein